MINNKKIMNIKMNDKTKKELFIFFLILICLWLIFYFIPEIFVTLFKTFLGNLILIFIIYFVFSYRVVYGIAIGIVFIIIYRIVQLSIKREAFEWSNESKKDFLLIQNSIHPNKIFDINMIKKNQASQEEVDYFIKNGLWPWSQKTKDIFIQSINSNPYVKIAPDAALLETQSIYNENAILRALSYQTKEGHFLIYGVQVPISGGNPAESLPSGFGDFAYKSGLLKQDKTKDIIRCNIDNASLERIHFTGKEGIYGSQTLTTTPVDYNDLENIIPGFSFISVPCNPCLAIKEKPDYSCPFNLKVKDKNPNISNIWKTLWGIN